MASPDPSIPGRPRVLIVDDDYDIREAIEHILTEEGYAVASSANGLDALSVLENGFAPCVILLDLMMPVMDGWQFRARQLSHPSFAAIPVIVLSADAQVEKKSRSLNVAACMKKPIDLDVLLALVARYCNAVSTSQRGPDPSPRA